MIAPLLAYPLSITSATKTDTLLMETPVSIQVRSQSLMLEQNLVQLRSATVLRLKNISFGVNQPRHFLGRLLSKCIAFSISSFLILLKLCCLGKNWRNKPCTGVLSCDKIPTIRSPICARLFTVKRCDDQVATTSIHPTSVSN